MSGNRLVSIMPTTARRCSPKLVHKRSSSVPNIEHATSTAGDAVYEMGGVVREMVLDMILRYWCQNNGSRIYNITGFHGYFAVSITD